MLVEEKLKYAASKLGEPQIILTNALKKEVLWKILELTQVVRRFEERYGIKIEDFESRNLLDELGHTWEIEKDYYDWDRAITELQKLEEIIRSLE